MAAAPGSLPGGLFPLQAGNSGLRSLPSTGHSASLGGENWEWFLQMQLLGVGKPRRRTSHKPERQFWLGRVAALVVG